MSDNKVISNLSSEAKAKLAEIVAKDPNSEASAYLCELLDLKPAMPEEKAISTKADEQFVQRCLQFRTDVEAVIEKQLDNVVTIRDRDYHVTKDNCRLLFLLLIRLKDYDQAAKICERFESSAQPVDLWAVVISQHNPLLRAFLNRCGKDNRPMGDTTPFLSHYAVCLVAAFGTGIMLKTAMEYRQSNSNGRLDYSANNPDAGWLEPVKKEIKTWCGASSSRISYPKFLQDEDATTSPIDWAMTWDRMDQAEILHKAGVKTNSVHHEDYGFSESRYRFMMKHCPDSRYFQRYAQLIQEILIKEVFAG